MIAFNDIFKRDRHFKMVFSLKKDVLAFADRFIISKDYADDHRRREERLRQGKSLTSEPAKTVQWRFYANLLGRFCL